MLCMRACTCMLCMRICVTCVTVWVQGNVHACDLPGVLKTGDSNTDILLVLKAGDNSLEMFGLEDEHVAKGSALHLHMGNALHLHMGNWNYVLELSVGTRCWKSHPRTAVRSY